MVDFSHVTKALDTSSKTVRFEFDMLHDVPVAIVRPATQSNSEYFSRAMQIGSDITKSLKRGKGISRETMKKLRERDYELFPRHVIVSWENPPTDASGAPVEMTPENTEQFLRALPEYVFEELRNFVGNEYNFLDHSSEDLEEHGKNS